MVDQYFPTCGYFPVNVYLFAVNRAGRAILISLVSTDTGSHLS